jgi:hypothetical protein
MALALLIAGIGSVVAGLLAILFGIPVKEFSFGNTLIIVGAIGVCSGMLLMALFLVVVELKNIARRLGATVPSEVRVRPVLPPGMIAPSDTATAEAARAEPMPPPASPPPWLDEAAARERQRAEAPPFPEATPPGPEAPRRRNLLFASTSRKERERAQAKAAEGLPPEQPPAPATPAPAETPPVSFEDAWPKPERARPLEAAAQRRQPPRLSSAVADPAAPAAPEPQPAPPAQEQPAVTVLKSGVVDGMAYSLYSDGSIEAQMPEGMMRFASIDELRTHLDQRS